MLWVDFESDSVSRVSGFLRLHNGCVPVMQKRNLSVCRVGMTRTEASIENQVETVEEQWNLEDGRDDAPQSPFLTGGMDITTAGATNSFTLNPMCTEKNIIVVRHGMSTWNEEKRIQVENCECDILYLKE